MSVLCTPREYMSSAPATRQSGRRRDRGPGAPLRLRDAVDRHVGAAYQQIVARYGDAVIRRIVQAGGKPGRVVNCWWKESRK